MLTATSHSIPVVRITYSLSFILFIQFFLKIYRCRPCNTHVLIIPQNLVVVRMRMLRLKDLTLAFVFLNYYGQPIPSGWFQFLVSPPLCGSSSAHILSSQPNANLYFGKLLVSLHQSNQFWSLVSVHTSERFSMHTIGGRLLAPYPYARAWCMNAGVRRGVFWVCGLGPKALSEPAQAEPISY